MQIIFEGTAKVIDDGKKEWTVHAADFRFESQEVWDAASRNLGNPILDIAIENLGQPLNNLCLKTFYNKRVKLSDFKSKKEAKNPDRYITN